MKQAIVLILLIPAFLHAQTAAERQKTIEYVQSLRQPDGGYRVDSDSKSSSLRATNAAIRALAYFGGELNEPNKTVEFVKSCFDKATGVYSDAPGGKPDVPLSAVGIMAAAQLKLPPDQFLRPGVDYLEGNANGFEEMRIAAAGLEAAGSFLNEKNLPIWIDALRALRNDDDSYGQPAGDARMTGSVVALFRRLKLPLSDERAARSLKVMQAGQLADGAFGKAGEKTGDLESSYRVMRAFHLLKQKPKDVEKLREFIAKCRNADGGYGVAPGRPSSLAATYFASIILHWMNS